MKQELIMACQMFLVPATILFAALGVAPTEQLKTLVSFMGIATSGVWYYRVFYWEGLVPIDRRTALILSGLFLFAWVIAFLVHGYWWWKGGKPDQAPRVAL
jgi:hypothetical protein